MEVVFFKIVAVDEETQGRFFSEFEGHRTHWSEGEESMAALDAGDHPVTLCSPYLLHASRHPLATWPFKSVIEDARRLGRKYSLHSVTLPLNVSYLAHAPEYDNFIRNQKVGAPRMILGPPVAGLFVWDQSSPVCQPNRTAWFANTNTLGLLHSIALTSEILDTHFESPEEHFVPENWILPALVQVDGTHAWFLDGILICCRGAKTDGEWFKNLHLKCNPAISLLIFSQSIFWTCGAASGHKKGPKGTENLEPPKRLKKRQNQKSIHCRAFFPIIRKWLLLH